MRRGIKMFLLSSTRNPNQRMDFITRKDNIFLPKVASDRSVMGFSCMKFSRNGTAEQDPIFLLISFLSFFLRLLLYSYVRCNSNK